MDQVIGKIWVQQARGVDDYAYHEHAARPKEAMRPSDIAFRDMTNDKLSEIFYAGAEKRGRY